MKCGRRRLPRCSRLPKNEEDIARIRALVNDTEPLNVYNAALTALASQDAEASGDVIRKALATPLRGYPQSYALYCAPRQRKAQKRGRCCWNWRSRGIRAPFVQSAIGQLNAAAGEPRIREQTACFPAG